VDNALDSVKTRAHWVTSGAHGDGVIELANRLIESDLVLHLSKPCALKDTSWIKPGKTTFPWWNGFVLDGVNFKPGLNTATTKYYLGDIAGATDFTFGAAFNRLQMAQNVASLIQTIHSYRQLIHITSTSRQTSNIIAFQRPISVSLKRICPY